MITMKPLFTKGLEIHAVEIDCGKDTFFAPCHQLIQEAVAVPCLIQTLACPVQAAFMHELAPAEFLQDFYWAEPFEVRA